MKSPLLTVALANIASQRELIAAKAAACSDRELALELHSLNMRLFQLQAELYEINEELTEC